MKDTPKLADCMSVKTKMAVKKNIGRITPSEIIKRKQVPVLCYHHIRQPNKFDSKLQNDVISPKKFSEHIKMLADSGYHTILPDDLYDYLCFGKVLPKKPIMITFDDSYKEQYAIASGILAKHNFKGVYFVITSTINRRKSLNKDQIKDLSTKGHLIASHTHTHKNFNKFKKSDWNIEVKDPAVKLESITKEKIYYLAYPYGLVNEKQFETLKRYNIKLAFILSTRRSRTYPLFTIRRIIDPGTNTSIQLYKSIIKSF